HSASDLANTVRGHISLLRYQGPIREGPGGFFADARLGSGERRIDGAVGRCVEAALVVRAIAAVRVGLVPRLRVAARGHGRRHLDLRPRALVGTFVLYDAADVPGDVVSLSVPRWGRVARLASLGPQHLASNQRRNRRSAVVGARACQPSRRAAFALAT